MRIRILSLTGLAIFVGWYCFMYRNEPRNDSSAPAGSGSPSSGDTAHSPEYRFTPLEAKPTPPDPEAISDERERLANLMRSIELEGKPKRQQGIVELRAFLQSRDAQVRFDAATMLYEMKDRSGYAALLALLSNPEPIPGKGGLDLRERAGWTFARYREKWAGEALLKQLENTKSTEFKPQALALRLAGIVPYLHESLKQQLWVDSIGGLAILEPENNQALFKRIADNDQMEPETRAAAILGLARSGDKANLERLMAVARNAKETLPGNHEDAYLAQKDAVQYLTNFRGDEMVEFFEDILTGKYKNSPRGVALVYLRYRYPQNKASREAVKAGLQPGGAIGWDYTLLLQLARLSGDPELIALGKQTDYFTSFRQLDVRAGWSNAWIGEYLPDWDGDW